MRLRWQHGAGSSAGRSHLRDIEEKHNRSCKTYEISVCLCPSSSAYLALGCRGNSHGRHTRLDVCTVDGRRSSSSSSVCPTYRSNPTVRVFRPPRTPPPLTASEALPPSPDGTRHALNSHILNRQQFSENLNPRERWNVNHGVRLCPELIQTVSPYLIT